jgi:hypothetical protein
MCIALFDQDGQIIIYSGQRLHVQNMLCVWAKSAREDKRGKCWCKLNIIFITKLCCRAHHRIMTR